MVPYRGGEYPSWSLPSWPSVLGTLTRQEEGLHFPATVYCSPRVKSAKLRKTWAEEAPSTYQQWPPTQVFSSVDQLWVLRKNLRPNCVPYEPPEKYKVKTGNSHRLLSFNSAFKIKIATRGRINNKRWPPSSLSHKGILSTL